MNVWIFLTVLSTVMLSTYSLDMAVEVVIDRSTICSDTTLTRDSEKCIYDNYKNANRKFLLPKLTSINNYFTLQSHFLSDNFTFFCSDTATLKTVAKCLVNTYRRCADDDFKTLIPTASQYEEAIDYICSNQGAIESMNKDRPISYLDCRYNREARQDVTVDEKPKRSSEFSVSKSYHCKRMAIDIECLTYDTDFLATEGSAQLLELTNKLKPSADCNAATGLVYTTSLLLMSLISLLFKHL